MNLKSNKGLTFVEMVVVASIFLLVMIPVLSIYYQSITNLYTTEKLTDSQKQGQNALFFVTQDLAGTVDFLSIGSTGCIVNTYKATTVGYYFKASDSTLRRVYGTSFTGGEIKARNLTGFKMTYFTDTTYETTLDSNLVNGVRCDITINIPASSLTNPSALDTSGYFLSSYIWCRNRTTN